MPSCFGEADFGAVETVVVMVAVVVVVVVLVVPVVVVLLVLIVVMLMMPAVAHHRCCDVFLNTKNYTSVIQQCCRTFDCRTLAYVPAGQTTGFDHLPSRMTEADNKKKTTYQELD